MPIATQAPAQATTQALPPRDLLANEAGTPVAGASDPRFTQYKVIRRNGAVVSFEPSKIAVAMTKAFLAVNGGQSAASARVREQVTNLTESVVSALVKRKPEGGAIHIEEIQDQVELALMRGGEHEAARAYVLYREKRSQERAAKVDATQKAHEIELTVTENGQRRKLDIARLTSLIESSCEGLPDAEPARILKSTLKDLYDGVPIEEVRKSVVLASRTLIEKDPAYSYVTARLLLDSLRHEALGEEATQAEMKDEVPRVLPAVREARREDRPAERSAAAVRHEEAGRGARSPSATSSSATSACRRSTTATSSSTSTSAGAASSCRSASSCASPWASR